MNCPYCRTENAADALVCARCSRDIGVPPTLIAERDELRRKRDLLREELRQARSEIEAIRGKRRS
jgi:NAD(P)H-hydrate repair Nnr-like enzyme with NAD(P)H-hydrate epimerase domain